MKRQSILISVITALVLLFSCSEDTLIVSSEISSRNYSYSEYTALEVNDNFKVFLSFSDTEEKFEVEANDNLHGYIKTVQVGDKVIVKLDGVDNIIGNETLNIFITTRNITDIKLRGNTNLVMENLVSSSTVNIDLVGNCFVSGSVNVGHMNLNSSGNNMVDISGSVGFLDAKLSGNCELSDYNLIIDDLLIDLSGNSNAYLKVSNSISIDGSGNSILFYQGDASIIHQNLSSDAKVIKV